MVKYVVRLHPQEREQLLGLVNTGGAAAAKVLHGRILLKADVSEERRPWTDTAIAEALDTSPATVPRVRQAFVEWGLETALARKPPSGRQYRTLDGTQEAQLIALACSAPPEGSTRWTFKLLADKAVVLNIVDRIRAECVRTTLKKMRASPGSRNSG